MEYLGFAASLIMGIILGLMGGGGSILTVPILVYLFSVSPVTATGYSLFVVGATALIGCLIYIRRKEIEYRVAIAFAVPSLLGVNISRGFIIPQIPSVVMQLNSFTLTKDILIMAVFAALMVAASYSMIKKSGPQGEFKVPPIVRMGLIALLGLAVGLVAGFVGAGGGFLIIPALVLIARLPMKTAVGTSLMIIAFQSLLGFVGDVNRGMNIQWPLLASIAVFAAIGIAIGSIFSNKIQDKKLKPAFGWFVLFMGFILLAEQIRQLSI